jgi:hypothetical protein
MTTRQKVQRALETGSKTAELTRVAAQFHQLDTVFFLMSYYDYRAIAAGDRPRNNAVDRGIAAGGYSGKTMSGPQLGSQASVGAWMFDYYISSGNGSISGVGSGAPMQINIPGPVEDELATIYEAPGKPFTPDAYAEAAQIQLNTLVADGRYSNAYDKALQ